MASLKALTQIPKPNSLDELPFIFDYPGVPPIRVCLDLYRDSHVEAVRQIWQDASSEGGGIGIDESPDNLEEQILHRANPRYTGLVLIDVAKSEVMCAKFVGPSLLCRSEKPLFFTGFLLVKKAYRRHGVAAYISEIVDPRLAAQYEGFLSRATVIAKSIPLLIHPYGHFPLNYDFGSTRKIIANLRKSDRISDLHVLNVNCKFLGIIPWCTHLRQGWVHDHITYGQARFCSDQTRNCRLSKLGSRVELEGRLPLFQKHPTMTNLSKVHHPHLGKLMVAFADKDDIWKIQDILRELALAGDGFGIDEFTADGVYNEKFIRSCVYMVVRKERDGEMVAAILWGDTGLCRSLNKEQAAGVLVVLEPFRRQGLGSQLLKWCEQEGRVFGYKSILTDVLASNAVGLRLMHKLGFFITGTLPKTCYVRDCYVDSFIHWKQLTEPTLPSSL